jgi:hypothetical protein
VAYRRRPVVRRAPSRSGSSGTGRRSHECPADHVVGRVQGNRMHAGLPHGRARSSCCPVASEES